MFTLAYFMPMEGEFSPIYLVTVRKRSYDGFRVPLGSEGPLGFRNVAEHVVRTIGHGLRRVRVSEKPRRVLMLLGSRP